MQLRIIDNRPAVCVKDRTLWAHDPRTRDMIAALPETVVQEIYTGVQEDFWRDIAGDIARDYGYSGEVYSEGRSSGWLRLGDNLTFLEYLDADDPWSDTWTPDDDDYVRAAIGERDVFLRFAQNIEAAVIAAGEVFIERLTDAVADLETRRETCLVRGDN